MNRQTIKIFLFLLLQSLFIPGIGIVRAQEITANEVFAISEIKLLTIPDKLSFKLENPIREYRAHRLDHENLRKIKENLLEQFHLHGFYLAKMDSVSENKNSETKQVSLSFFIYAGPEFRFGKISLTLNDSLQEEFSQSLNEIREQYTGKTYTAAAQNRLFSDFVSIFENAGYPLTKISTMEFSLDSLGKNSKAVNLNLNITPGPRVVLSGLRLPADSHIDKPYIRRILRFKPGEIYRENKVQRYYRILGKEEYLENVQMPQVVIGRDSLYYLSLIFEEGTTTTFDGVVGYIPPPANNPAENGYFTGLLNIGLRNLFGTGRKLNVHWQKPDRFSEEFRVKFREPFVLGLPFHTGAEMYRLVRDTTYIEWEYSLNFEFPLNENLLGLFRFYSRQVYPDSLASMVLRLPQTKSIHSELGFEWDTRDNLYNPRHGIYLTALFDYGTQRNVGPAYLLREDSLIDKTNVTKLKANLEFLFETWKKQVVSLDFHTVLIGYQGESVRLPDMFWFGGATTIRGYREQQFFAQQVGWVNNEYRFLLGPRSRFFVFTDAGYYYRKVPEVRNEFLLGYGLGIRVPGPIGVMQVDYGLAKGLSFREGKIHFRLINEF